ncbi:MAG: Hpt domain-containing protein [Deltaproteobacteria bacterium]|nr:Hpt domain-containing protein [Deltaproteobacteria bacterium]
MIVSAEPVLAIEETLERMSGDKELLVNLFALYQTDAPKKLENIAQSAAETDYVLVGRLAHSLKGASATVGAARMCQLAIALEQAAKASDSAAVAQKLEAIREACADTLEEMRRFASGN